MVFEIEQSDKENFISVINGKCSLREIYYRLDKCKIFNDYIKFRNEVTCLYKINKLQPFLVSNYDLKPNESITLEKLNYKLNKYCASTDYIYFKNKIYDLVIKEHIS